MWNLLLRGSSKILPPNLEKTSECSHHTVKLTLNPILSSSLLFHHPLHFSTPSQSTTVNSPPTFSFILFIYIFPLLSPLFSSPLLFISFSFSLFCFSIANCRLLRIWGSSRWLPATWINGQWISIAIWRILRTPSLGLKKPVQ